MMKTKEKSQSVEFVSEVLHTPICEETDVLVLGSGPAGLGAAVWAAREGARTQLIEQLGDVGGIATSGLMSHWTGSTQGGFYAELLQTTSDLRDNEDGSGRHIINPETLKTRLLDLLDGAGVRTRLYTQAVLPLLDGACVRGVITESKAGRQAIRAKIVIDATGDGDIAARAGVPFVLGRETDGKMQPVSIMFKVAGVDLKRGIFPGSFETNPMILAGPIQDVGRAHLPHPAGHVLLYPATLPGVVTCNMTNSIDIDGTDPEDLTRATRECRHQIEAIIPFLREFVPGFEACYLISSASLIGVRETRHFAGLSLLTEQDIAEARVFPDWAVTKAHFNFDVHNLTGSGLDVTGAQESFRQKHGYTIPYGCFVPQNMDGLMLAGRNISGTHLAHSNYRVMPICANMGQSVGIAAACCVRFGCQPRELDISALQKRLRAFGIEP